MTWTYNYALPTDRDKLRMLVGDTDAADHQLQNEAMDLFLTQEGSLYPAAAAACRALVGAYARRVDVGNAGLSLAASQRVEHYTRLALTYERRARVGAGAGGIGTPFVGGVSIASINADRTDADMLQGRMRHDLHDEPSGDTVPEIEP